MTGRGDVDVARIVDMFTSPASAISSAIALVLTAENW